MSKLSRRKFLFTAGATAAGTLIIHGCAANNNPSTTSTTTSAPAPAVNINPADAPEIATATLGFIALTDSAPLIIALEKGFFAKYGMSDVKVLKQASWPVTRDNLELGSGGGGIDGAHILSPMPYLMTLGTITKQPVPMYLLARLNTNGQAISLGKEYLDAKITVNDSAKFKDILLTAKNAGKELKAAITFPGGTHDLWMRYWLASGGTVPDTDISIIPVPPPQMVANMKVGNMEGFCVADWVDKNPKAAKALTMAVLEAQQWCDKPENIEEMCKIVSQDKWFKVPFEDIIERSRGNIDFGDGRVITASPIAMKFWRDNASYPYKSHDSWFLTEDIRWGYLPADLDIKATVDKVNREDLWREAAKSLNVPAAEIPATPSRGIETFFDGVQFNPEDPKAYLNSLAIKKV
jgi:nitrate/nitrite transport system substrate-binding protein